MHALSHLKFDEVLHVIDNHLFITGSGPFSYASLWTKPPAHIGSRSANLSSSHNSFAAMSKDQRSFTSPASFHLPNELWAEVLAHIDDPYDLWVICRQVSRTFRQEAKRAFRSQFLPQIRIQYMTRGPKASPRRCYVRLKLDSTTPDSSTGRFVVRTCSWQANPNWRHVPRDHYWLNFLSDEHRITTLKAAATWKDVDALSRVEDGGDHSPDHRMQVWFKSAKTDNLACWKFVNDVEIPNIQFHPNKFISKTIPMTPIIFWKEGYATLDWEKLLTDLFSEEAFVRRKLAQAGEAPNTAFIDVKALFDTALTSIHQKCPTFGSHKGRLSLHQQEKPTYESIRNRFIEDIVATQASQHTKLYEAAYEARIRKAYAAAGLEFPADVADVSDAEPGKYHTHVETHVRLLQKFRKMRLQKFAERYWDAKVGAVHWRWISVEGF